ncbi:tubulin gamma complex associated family protein [Aspergillus saccharolyticus JOP 1030-1]|uniref:Spindle pole body component n=1 Tax=Aspergillus saccharolyticus JOP 1030-1 TaxID=1450539 RepID=A0A319APW0_9EURO|nr:gamma-tubulin complex component GCP6 [Aspergillus saccharolyticus JOP 1030-1]PYH48442.1 gamma-tubulin complex component GCP6 [Aspergillus saccharolyticus JOP 1030-1]
MNEEEYIQDPFSSDGLWKISEFTLQCLPPLDSLPWDGKLPDLSGGFFKLPLDLFEKDAPRIPELDVFDTNFADPEPALLPSLDTSSESQFGISVKGVDGQEQAEEEEQPLDNIWDLDMILHNPCHEVSLKSWEKFLNRTHRDIVSAYFSESGAKGFDAALAHQAAKINAPEKNLLVRNDSFFQALYRLGLGWGSLFFRYNQQGKTFEIVHNNLRISGVTSTTLKAVTDDLIQCGNKMQRIRRFVDDVPLKSNELSTLGAFSSAAAVVIYTLEKQLARHATRIASLLQIKSLFMQSGDLVHVLADMVDAVQGAVSEAQLISVVLERAAHFSQVYSQMEPLLRQVITRVMEPWLSYVETWVGFQPETSTSIELASTGRTFVLRETHDNHTFASRVTSVDYKFLPELMPSFVPSDQAKLIFETGRTLRLLKRNHPQHPIANHATYRADSIKLDCAGTWLDIEKIQRNASAYEARLRAAILKYNRKAPVETDTAPTPDASAPETHSEIEGTYELFDIDKASKTAGLLPDDETISQNQLGRLIQEAQPLDESPHLQENDLSPELTSSPYLSLAPLLSSQAILIDYSCLHMLFKEHNLRTHLTLQWRFQLLGDGFFVTRLSNALFDPEMTSGERKPGVVRTAVHTGLRLGTRSRHTWPPASSELRLVLIGLLDESSSSSTTTSNTNTPQPHDHLSFSIRNLSAAEVQRARNPHALEALDFLRLIYTPPTDVLSTILTPTSLAKYDRLFQHLLRLQRMLSVATTLIRDSTARTSLSGDTHNIYQRFRVEAQHFILVVSDYCYHVAVGAAWTRFQDRLARIEDCLARGDIDGTIEAAGSVQQLREMHEAVLDEMLEAMLISEHNLDPNLTTQEHDAANRLEKGRRWLEACFASILEFAPLSRVDGAEGVRGGEAVEEVRRLYAMFRKQIAGFAVCLRGGVDGGHLWHRDSVAPPVGGRRVAGGKGPDSVFEHLLARLEVKAYY